MKSYILTYGHSCVPEHVQGVLNDIDAIETWVSPFPYAAIVISELEVGGLSAMLRERLPDAWFMVAELRSEAVRGWLPGKLWEYVSDPQRAPERARALFASAG